MVQTPSTMLGLGTTAPEFTLLEPATGKRRSLSEFNSAATVIMFICNHCPFVKHLADSFTTLSNEYMKKGVAVIAINSNDIEKYPQDGPDKMQEEIVTRGYKFPYLLDADQSVAKAYKAACTPDFYLFGPNLKLAYRGQWDDSRPGNAVPVSGVSMRQALDSLLLGKTPDLNQKPSLGCNIKWK